MKKRLTIDDIPKVEYYQEKYQAKKNLLIGKVQNPDLELQAKSGHAMNFLFYNFWLLEKQDYNLVSGLIKRAALYYLGIFTIYISTITRGYIYELPRFIRIPIRLGIFICPAIYFFGFYQKDPLNRVSLYMVDKYMDRIGMYMKFQDPRLMNPYFGEEDE